jgi:hypothetical protein
VPLHDGQGTLNWFKKKDIISNYISTMKLCIIGWCIPVAAPFSQWLCGWWILFIEMVSGICQVWFPLNILDSRMNKHSI